MARLQGPEWLYEEGIGENRAILIEDGQIAEAAIELPGTLPAGSIVPARMTRILVPRRRGILAIEGGEALIEPLAADLTEGQALTVEILREALAEEGRSKLARARASSAPVRPGPTLRDRIGGATRSDPVGPDRFEEAGWSELLEEASSGEIAFIGGALRMSLTPAMTLFDVDGDLPPAVLAMAGAEAAARAIRRFGVTGSIGIDLPTMPAKADRQAAAEAVDAILPQPFERTAVNGFGFLQIVRKRERPSLPELLQADRVGAAARALLRRAERTPGSGPRILHAAPAVAARIERHPQWLDALARRLGAPASLQAEPGLAISAGHVHSRTL
ncbi:ribonuclease [Sphingosinicella rhizophila]|uniref:Ribonuclease n=1 Tax=Sphingosinicella rhizophila TaxID=3050082 RepID=A0ABU3Q8K4_9SPHN|nr:ribonuclease [Sphingosinicella sp. GR2756]MDT9599729.1 ribonuclease [Sphingosinicella sp. GR2756]